MVIATGSTVILQLMSISHGDTRQHPARAHERDGRIDGIESSMMESAWVAQQIGL